MTRYLCLAAAALAVLAACKPAPPATDGGRAAGKVNSTAPKWVHRNAQKPDVAVVFIHGIFGDTIKTWGREGEPSFFDLLRLDQKLGSSVDIFAFGYTSDMLGSGSLDIQEAANLLHQHLEYHKVHDYPAVVFVAHSMGGLVTLRHLLTRREHIARVPLIVFFGTPQEGAQIASIGRHILGNDALLQMLPADRDGYLRTLNDEWRSLPAGTRPPIKCGYEKKETFGVMIVPWSSATRFCDSAAVALAANHLDIVKPGKSEDDSVVLLVNALNEHVAGVQFKPKLETPDFLEENGQVVLKMMSAQARQPASIRNAGRRPLTYQVNEVSDPSLYVWPGDNTELSLPGRTTTQLHFALGAGARDTPYSFVLRTSIPSEQKVVLKVPDIKEVQAFHARMAKNVAERLTAFAGDPARKEAWRISGASDDEVQEALVREAKRVVAESTPGLPEAGQWAMTTEVLNSFNFYGLGKRALKKVEEVSPASVKSSSVLRLSDITSALSGKEVFTKAVPATGETKVIAWRDNSLWGQQGHDMAVQFATALEGVPALKSFGLSLKSDMLYEKGDTPGAVTTLREAAKYDPAPYIQNRYQFKPDGSPVKSTQFSIKSSEVAGRGAAAAAKGR